LHAYPEVRFAAKYPHILGKNRVRYVASGNMCRPTGNIFGINQAVVLDATYLSTLKRSQKRHQRRVIDVDSLGDHQKLSSVD